VIGDVITMTTKILMEENTHPTGLKNKMNKKRTDDNEKRVKKKENKKEQSKKRADTDANILPLCIRTC